MPILAAMVQPLRPVSTHDIHKSSIYAEKAYRNVTLSLRNSSWKSSTQGMHAQAKEAAKELKGHSKSRVNSKVNHVEDPVKFTVSSISRAVRTVPYRKLSVRLLGCIFASQVSKHSTGDI